MAVNRKGRQERGGGLGNRASVKADTVPLRTLRALRLIKNKTAKDAKNVEFAKFFMVIDKSDILHTSLTLSAKIL